jgi:integrase/recombinase XerD
MLNSTLKIYRRHHPACPKKDMDRAFNDVCKCPLWVDGVLDGKELRASLKTKTLRLAKIKLHAMENPESAPDVPSSVALAYAWDSLIADLESNGLTASTVRKYKLLKRQMLAYAEPRGLTLLSSLDLDALDRFRRTWKDSPRTAEKKLERLRRFYKFAVDREWCEKNIAARLSHPRVPDRPTLPLTDAEMTKILTACDTWILTAPTGGKLNGFRLKTLVLLMRYSGLRVSDAVTLSPSALDGNRLYLSTQKTGTRVCTILPDFVVSELTHTPKVSDRYFFWSGEGKRESVVCHWQMRLKKLFDLAEISKGNANAISHRFRDTFAVKLLERGIPIERVSVLLGHKSVRVTEKHYSPWVKSRQEQLEQDVASAWTHDKLLQAQKPGTFSVQPAKGPVN